MKNSTNLTTLILLFCGILGPILFMTCCLVIGVSIPGYNPTSNFVSFMTIGEFGWLERTNEIVCSIFIILFGLGLSLNKKTLGLLTVFAGVSGVVTALAPTSTELWPGMLHRLAAGALFFTVILLITTSVKHVKHKTWLPYTYSTIFVILTSILVAVTFNPTFKGVLQRLSLAVMLAWLVSLATHFLRKSLNPTLVKQP